MTREESNYIAQLEQKVAALQAEVDALKKKITGEPVFETKYSAKPDTIYYWGDYHND